MEDWNDWPPPPQREPSDGPRHWNMTRASGPDSTSPSTGPRLFDAETPVSHGPLFAAPKPRRTVVQRILVPAIVFAVAAGLVGLAAGRQLAPTAGSSATATSVQPVAVAGTTLSAAEVAAVANKVSPGVVDVNTVLSYQSAKSEGTGIVLNSSGLVLTNNHVIAGSTSISAVDVGNGQTYPAYVVGYDRSSDVAVIQLEGASGLTVAPLGNSSTLKVGQSVVGIGNAGGVGGQPSTAAGWITALHQITNASEPTFGTTEHLVGLIQSNAPIRSGDSGGPLADKSGTVVGMDTAADASWNQGYSIPINTALAIVHAINSKSSSPSIHLGETGFLGITVQPVSTTGPVTPAGSSHSKGLAIVSAVPGGPASAAGLVQGDIINSISGFPVTSANELFDALGRFHPGDTVTVNWSDPTGATHVSKMILATGPAA